MEIRYVHIFLGGVLAALVLSLGMIALAPIEATLGGAPVVPGASV